MDVLTSETCWAVNKWNNKASDIKLVSLYSTKNIWFGSLYSQQRYLYFLSYYNEISLHNKTGYVRITWHLGAFVQQLFQWKSNKYFIFGMFVCCLRYQTCNAHAPYCHLWPAPLYTIFPHYLINGTIFGKMLLKIKWVSIFSTPFVWKVFRYKKNWARYDKKCTLVFV